MDTIIKYIKSYLMMFVVVLAGGWNTTAHAQVSVTISEGTNVEVTGTIIVEVDGDWINDGNLVPGNSQFVFKGDFPQHLYQNGGSFNGLIINKPKDNLTLTGDIIVTDYGLYVNKGDVDLNSHFIYLEPATSLYEVPLNTVMGSSGYIYTVRQVNAPVSYNVAGMGLVLTSSDDFGNTELRRGHAAQISNGHTGINRYYELYPTHVGQSPISVIFRYDESELNSNDEAALRMFGSNDGGATWEEIPGTLDVINNHFAAVLNTFYTRITLNSNAVVGLDDYVATENSASCVIELENYPNPFSNNTEVRFRLPDSGVASLALFDVQGRLIRHIAEGTYDNTWQNISLNSDGLAEGVYIIRVESHCGSKTTIAVVH